MWNSWISPFSSVWSTKWMVTGPFGRKCGGITALYFGYDVARPFLKGNQLSLSAWVLGQRAGLGLEMRPRLWLFLEAWSQPSPRPFSTTVDCVMQYSCWLFNSLAFRDTCKMCVCHTRKSLWVRLPWLPFQLAPHFGKLFPPCLLWLNAIFWLFLLRVLYCCWGAQFCNSFSISTDCQRTTPELLNFPKMLVTPHLILPYCLGKGNAPGCF